MISEKESIMYEYAVEAKGLTYAYNSTTLFESIDLNVKIGKCIAILGKSGSGKSTLLRIINGSIRPLRGEVRVLGVNIYNGHMNGVRRKISYIPQSLGLVYNMSVLENVMLSRAADSPFRASLGLWKGEYVNEAIGILRSIGLDDKAKRKVNNLSGGEMQRVAIARALMQRASIILADEPVSNLDDDNARSIIHLIKGLTDKGTTAIVVIHNKRLAEEYMDEAYYLGNGLLERVW
jgi:phosphonate transport system ATP-binding protein